MSYHVIDVNHFKYLYATSYPLLRSTYRVGWLVAFLLLENGGVCTLALPYYFS